MPGKHRRSLRGPPINREEDKKNPLPAVPLNAQLDKKALMIKDRNHVVYSPRTVGFLFVVAIILIFVDPRSELVVHHVMKPAVISRPT